MPEYGKIRVRENHYSDTFYAIYLYPISKPSQIYFCQTSSKNFFTEHLRATVLVFNSALFPSRCCFIYLNHVAFFKWLLESVFEEYLLTCIVNLNYKTLHHVLEKVITTAYFYLLICYFYLKIRFSWTNLPEKYFLRLLTLCLVLHHLSRIPNLFCFQA